MRFKYLAALVVLTSGAAPGLAAEDCRKAVETSFNKQRQSKAYRVEVTNPANNDGAEQVFEYLPPLTMYRKITAPGLPQPMESIGFGNRAWMMEGAGWLEMQPHFAESHKQHLMDLFGAPVSIKTDYTCLGDAAFEGKSYKAYQTQPEKGDDGVMLVRTVYVDGATGLPTFNIVGTLSGDKPPLVREAYSYPEDIKIDIPEGAPMQSIQH